MRKIILILCCVCAAVICTYSITGIYGHLSDQNVKSNPVTIGSLTTEIQENFPTPSPLIPGTIQEFTKTIQVTNNQSVPCYVRVYLCFSSNEWETASTYNHLNTTDWVFQPLDEDNLYLGGYYYYIHPLAPGETSLPLLEGLTVNTPNENAIDSVSFDLTVYHESIQQGIYADYETAWKSV